MLKLALNNLWGRHTPYCYVIIIRGIGYRAFNIVNDIVNPVCNANCVFETENEFIYNTYLIIRAGHTVDWYIGLPPDIRCFITKKDRKLVLTGGAKGYINYLSINVADYRRPSAYTGRGLRIKKNIVVRKAGKKDKQKGKAF